MQWIIHKSTRLPDHPYEGPTCDRAGVPKGKVYTDKGEAERDAALLAGHNAVGFEVAPWPHVESANG